MDPTIFQMSLAECTGAFSLLRLLAEAASVHKTRLEDAPPASLALAQESALHLVQSLELHPQIAEAQWVQIRGWAKKTLQEGTSLEVVAFGLLKALDRAGTFGPKIGALFSNKEFEVQEGQLFPIAHHNLKTLFGDKVPIVSRPSSQGSLSGSFDNFGILPRLEEGFRVRFDTRVGSCLATLRSSPVVAVGLPNCQPTELTRDEDEASRTFFAVRPVDEQGQLTRIMTLLDAADAKDASVVLLPELCSTPLVSKAIQSAVREKSLKFVVGGSFHQRRCGNTEVARESRVNRAEAFAAGAPQMCFAHHKFSPFELLVNDRLSLKEDITIDPVITVYWGSGWSFCLLICKDALNKVARQLLESLRPNFVFVAAYSRSTAGFSDLVALAASAQSIVLVANFCGEKPRRGRDFEAMLVCPVGRATPKYGMRKGKVLSPGLHFISLRDRLPRWSWSPS